ncbi:Aminoglycoside phosphotransferase family protein [Mycena venus]|uniref:Aminoglycoside phosphotransferase family protein n=1 Tax=Mycena venus TaxID=2733690 RepID=A0A8H7CW56_9AGAR|nr:Aminoglycoside phosphotransferase family protein [Mycena venus]
MLALIYRTDSLAPVSLHELSAVLASYGLNNVIEWDQRSVPAQLSQVKDRSSDIIFVNADYTLGTMAVRRLTLSSVRLPSTFAVWDGQKLVAARVKLPTFEQLVSKNQGEKELTTSFRELVDSKRIESYTLQQLSDISSIRMGGSFAGSGIQRYYGKSASGLGTKKLRDEIRMYQTLPERLRSHYPKLLFASDDEVSGVSMGTQYEDHPNIRDLLLNMDIAVPDAVRVLQQVLEFEFCEAYLAHKQPLPENYLHDYHFHRVWRRIAVSKELDPSFGSLVAAPWLQVNGERLPNVPSMLLRLEQDHTVVKRLQPDGASPFIHADLHLENILCDVANSRFWLIDPRGYPACDIYYDLGKLAHSYHSYYDLLHEGRHVADFSLSTDRQTAIINYEFTSKKLVARYSDLNVRMDKIIHDLLERHGESRDDIDLRIRFNEAMHFCSDMPFHINPEAKPFVAQPIYAIGAKLLAEVLQILGIGLDECVRKHDEAMVRLADMGHRPWLFEG